MHNNVLSLRWERRKRREQDKEAKVSQARQRCRFLVSLSNSKHPTLLAPLAALGGQTKRRMFVRKVTKINKSETPPPTTWPKARGSHAAPFAPRIFFFFLRRLEKSRAGRRRPVGWRGAHGRPQEQLGSSHSVARGLAVLLRCWGKEGKEAYRAVGHYYHHRCSLQLLLFTSFSI